MRTTIDQLRSSYRDQIYPLEYLRISFPGMLIKMVYVDENSGGVFRIHPRLSQIEIWPDTESAISTLKKQLGVEGEILDRIYLKTSLRKAKESIIKARDTRRPPDRDAMSIVRGTRIRPKRARRPSRDEKRRVITLREIEDAIRSIRRKDHRGRWTQQKRLEITLRPDAPVKLVRYSPVKLIVEFV